MNPGTSSIEFRPEGHEYWLGGRKLPSVTQVMEPMSLMLYRDVPPDVLHAAADRGTRAHEQVANIVRYDFAEEDEDTAPYIAAFQCFVEAYRPSWEGAEMRTYHRRLMYAGTIDLIGHVTPDDGNGLDVIDIKCTAAYHAVMLGTQLGGYAEALRSHGVAIRKLYGLQLKKDGTYHFEAVKERFDTFIHCLAIYNEMALEVHS